jgi:hypothetical protein
MKNVKTTAIEKKYKDKKTGEWKSLTINHAKVNDRLKAFWEANPKGKIETTNKKDDTTIEFKTFILADKSDQYSREATGHALANLPLGEKDYEKLETISVGRALALLGYSASGEVASTEEMEEFIEYQKEKKQQSIEEAKMLLTDCKSLEELQDTWKALGIMIKEPEVITLKDELKTKLS